ncbi:centromere-associated protein E-like [Periplaneta americana]|uniref:centromere-associated protein E-like n=1 Tax=Periplaneta americana TaxID=6978 RepID=UPI0037E88DB9
MSDKIKVAVKVRPLIEREESEGFALHWHVKNDTIFQIDNEGKQKGDTFSFDHVFDTGINNSHVFNTIARPIVDSSVVGFNGTIFAYGQTSSGKTYTMMGTDQEPGIIPLTVNYMFEALNKITGREFLLRASYIEIYNEKINDLLQKGKTGLKLREAVEGNVVISDLKEELVHTPAKIMDLMKRGEKIRRLGETNMNERSSRSHTIFRIIIESRVPNDGEDGAVQVSHLNLVDLAGSERLDQTGAKGDRLKEGCSINRSLFMLSHVISQLSEGQDQYVNFRDSKLTRILQSSLGGNAHTAIICAVTPASVEETASTLGFALRATHIKNKPQVNEVLSDAALLKRYARQITKLQAELEKTKSSNRAFEVEKMESKLQEQQKHNELLQERIDLLKEKLLGCSATDVLAIDKRRAQRRRTWCGRPSRLSIFPSSSLETIDEWLPDSFDDIKEEYFSDSVHALTNNTLFETPLEEFELQLIDAEKRLSEESLKLPDQLSHITHRKDKGHHVKFEDQIESFKPDTFSGSGYPSNSVQQNGAETPPARLRERVAYLSREYDELREFTTLERQIYNHQSYQEFNCMEKENKYLKKSVSDLEKMLRDVRYTNSLLQDENTALKENLRIQSEKCSEFANNLVPLHRLENSLSQSESEIAGLKEKLRLAEQRIKLLENEKRDANIILELSEAKHKNRIEELTQSLEDAHKQLQEIPSPNIVFMKDEFVNKRRMEGAVDIERQEYSTVKEQFDIMKGDLQVISQHNEEKYVQLSENENLETHLQLQNKKCRELEIMLDRLQIGLNTKNTDLEKDSSSIEKINSLLSEERQLCCELNLSLKKSSEKLENMKIRKSDIESEMKTLEKELTAKEHELNQERDCKEIYEKELGRLQTDLIKIQEEKRILEVNGPHNFTILEQENTDLVAKVQELDMKIRDFEELKLTCEEQSEVIMKLSSELEKERSKVEILQREIREQIESNAEKDGQLHSLQEEQCVLQDKISSLIQAVATEIDKKRIVEVTLENERKEYLTVKEQFDKMKGDLQQIIAQHEEEKCVLLSKIQHLECLQLDNKKCQELDRLQMELNAENNELEKDSVSIEGTNSLLSEERHLCGKLNLSQMKSTEELENLKIRILDTESKMKALENELAAKEEDLNRERHCKEVYEKELQRLQTDLIKMEEEKIFLEEDRSQCFKMLEHDKINLVAKLQELEMKTRDFEELKLTCEEEKEIIMKLNSDLETECKKIEILEREIREQIESNAEKDGQLHSLQEEQCILQDKITSLIEAVVTEIDKKRIVEVTLENERKEYLTVKEQFDKMKGDLQQIIAQHEEEKYVLLSEIQHIECLKLENKKCQELETELDHLQMELNAENSELEKDSASLEGINSLLSKESNLCCELNLSQKKTTEELENLKIRILDTESKMKALENELAAKDEELKKERHCKEVCEKELQRLQTDLIKMEEEKKTLEEDRSHCFKMLEHDKANLVAKLQELEMKTRDFEELKLTCEEEKEIIMKLNSDFETECKKIEILQREIREQIESNAEKDGQLHSLQEEQCVLQDKISSLIEAVATEIDKKRIVEVALENERQEYSTVKEEFDKMKGDLQQIIAQHEEEKCVLLSKIQHLECLQLENKKCQELDRLQMELNAENNELEKDSVSIEGTNSPLSEEKHLCGELNLSQKKNTEELENLTIRILDTESKMKTLENELTAKEEELNKERHCKEVYEKELRRLQTDLIKMEEEKKTLEEDHSHCVKTLEEEKADVVSKLEEFEVKIRDFEKLKLTCEEQSEVIMKLSSELEKERSKVEILQREIREQIESNSVKDGQLQSLQEKQCVLQDKISSLIEAVATEIDEKRILEVALENERQEYSTVKEEFDKMKGDLQQIIAQHEEEKCMLLSKIQHLECLQLDNKKCQELDRLQMELNAENNELEKDSVSIEGTNSPLSEEKHLCGELNLSQKKSTEELENLTIRILDRESKMKTLENELAAKEEELNKERQCKEVYEKELRRLQTDLIKMEEEKKTLEEDHSHSVKTLEEEKADVVSKLEEFEVKIRDFEKLKLTYEEQSEVIMKLSSELEKERSKVEILQREVREQIESNSVKDGQLQSLQEKQCVLQDKISSLIEAVATEIDEKRILEVALENERKEYSTVKEEFVKMKGDLQQIIAQHEEEKCELLSEVQRLEECLQLQNEKCRELETELHHLQLELYTKNSDLEKDAASIKDINILLSKERQLCCELNLDLKKSNENLENLKIRKLDIESKKKGLENELAEKEKELNKERDFKELYKTELENLQAHLIEMEKEKRILEMNGFHFVEMLEEQNCVMLADVQKLKAEEKLKLEIKDSIPENKATNMCEIRENDALLCELQSELGKLCSATEVLERHSLKQIEFNSEGVTISKLQKEIPETPKEIPLNLNILKVDEIKNNVELEIQESGTVLPTCSKLTNLLTPELKEGRFPRHIFPKCKSSYEFPSRDGNVRESITTSVSIVKLQELTGGDEINTTSLDDVDLCTLQKEDHSSTLESGKSEEQQLLHVGNENLTPGLSTLGGKHENFEKLSLENNEYVKRISSDLETANRKLSELLYEIQSCRTSIVTEIRSLKPSCNMESLGDCCLLELFNIFLTYVMEKEAEIFLDMQDQLKEGRTQSVDLIRKHYNNEEHGIRWVAELEGEVEHMKLSVLEQEKNTSDLDHLQLQEEKIALNDKVRHFEDKLSTALLEVKHLKYKFLEKYSSLQEEYNNEQKDSELRIEFENESKRMKILDRQLAQQKADVEKDSKLQILESMSELQEKILSLINRHENESKKKEELEIMLENKREECMVEREQFDTRKRDLENISQCSTEKNSFMLEGQHLEEILLLKRHNCQELERLLNSLQNKLSAINSEFSKDSVPIEEENSFHSKQLLFSGQEIRSLTENIGANDLGHLKRNLHVETKKERSDEELPVMENEVTRERDCLNIYGRTKVMEENRILKVNDFHCVKTLEEKADLVAKLQEFEMKIRDFEQLKLTYEEQSEVIMKLSSELENERRKVEILQREIREQIESNSVKDGQLQSLQEKQCVLQDKISSLTEAVTSEIDEKIILEVALENERQEYSTVKGQFDKMKGDLQQIIAQHEEEKCVLLSKIQHLEECLQLENKKFGELETELHCLQMELSTKNSELEKDSESMKEINSFLSKERQLCFELNLSLKNSIEELEHLKIRNLNIESKVESLENELAVKEEKLNKERNCNEVYKKELGRFQADLIKMEEEKRILEGNCSECVKILEQEKVDLVAKLQEYEMKAKEFEQLKLTFEEKKEVIMKLNSDLETECSKVEILQKQIRDQIEICAEKDGQLHSLEEEKCFLQDKIFSLTERVAIEISEKSLLEVTLENERLEYLIVKEQFDKMKGDLQQIIAQHEDEKCVLLSEKKHFEKSLQLQNEKCRELETMLDCVQMKLNDKNNELEKYSASIKETSSLLSEEKQLHCELRLNLKKSTEELENLKIKKLDIESNKEVLEKELTAKEEELKRETKCKEVYERELGNLQADLIKMEEEKRIIEFNGSHCIKMLEEEKAVLVAKVQELEMKVRDSEQLKVTCDEKNAVIVRLSSDLKTECSKVEMLQRKIREQIEKNAEKEEKIHSLEGEKLVLQESISAKNLENVCVGEASEIIVLNQQLEECTMEKCRLDDENEQLASRIVGLEKFTQKIILENVNLNKMVEHLEKVNKEKNLPSSTKKDQHYEVAQKLKISNDFEDTNMRNTGVGKGQRCLECELAMARSLRNILENEVTCLRKEWVKLREQNTVEINDSVNEFTQKVENLQSQLNRFLYESSTVNENCKHLREIPEKTILNEEFEGCTQEKRLFDVENEQVVDLERLIEKISLENESLKESVKRLKMEKESLDLKPCIAKEGFLKNVATDTGPCRECQDLRNVILEQKTEILELKIKTEELPHQQQLTELENKISFYKSKCLNQQCGLRRLQHQLQDGSLKCESCIRRESLSHSHAFTQTEDPSSMPAHGSGIVREHMLTSLRIKVHKLETKNELLKNLCRFRNKKILHLEEQLQSFKVNLGLQDLKKEQISSSSSSTICDIDKGDCYIAPVNDENSPDPSRSMQIQRKTVEKHSLQPRRLRPLNEAALDLEETNLFST